MISSVPAIAVTISTALAKFPMEIGPGDESQPDRLAVAIEGSGVIPVHTRRGRNVTEKISSRVGRRQDAYSGGRLCACWLGPHSDNPSVFLQRAYAEEVALFKFVRLTFKRFFPINMRPMFTTNKTVLFAA